MSNLSQTWRDGWEVRPIDSLARVRGGKRLPKGRSLTAIPTPHPYVRVTDMRSGHVDTSDLRYVPKDVAPSISAYRVSKEDIYISVAGTLGIVGRIPPELDGANLTENADRITAISCDIDYLMYWLLSEPIQNEIAAIRTVGAQPKLALGRIKRFEIMLPKSTREQKRVSAALKDVDRTIATLERLMIKKQAIQQGTRQELLTGMIRLPGFTEPWTGVRLGDLGVFLKGRGVKREDVRAIGVPCIRYGELYTVFNNYADTTHSFVDTDVAATALPIRSGDILFACSGETRAEIGMTVAYVGAEDAVAGGDIVVLRAQEINPIYLATVLNTPAIVSQKSRAGQGDAVVHINSRALADIDLNLPRLVEQDAIAHVLLDADCEIAVLGQRLTKARAVKIGMMQELLTGRTRLPVEAVGLPHECR